MKKWKKITVSALCLALVGGGCYGVHKHNQHYVTRQVIRNRPMPSYEQYVDYRPSNEQVPYDLNSTGVHAKASLVLDKGQAVASHNADKPMKVASTGKLMTLYLVQRKARHDHAWNDKITVPKNISRMSYDTKDQVGSELKLKAGHRYTVKDLYQSALIESSDSASILLGEWTAGSNARFVRLMNIQAREWHLNGHFNSASGLENDSIAKFGFKVSGRHADGNRLSARDLGIIASHLLKEFPQVTKWSSEPSAKVDGAVMSNVNADLPGQNYGVNGCDGLKTGYTPSAGFCFVGTRKDGRSHRIIVLLNDSQVFRDGKDLLE